MLSPSVVMCVQCHFQITAIWPFTKELTLALNLFLATNAQSLLHNQEAFKGTKIFILDRHFLNAKNAQKVSTTKNISKGTKLHTIE